jgi:hypothetical protein
MDNQFGDSQCCRIIAIDQSELNQRAFERLRQASNVFWSKPMIVLEKHSDGHEKLKLAHGGTSAQSIGMNNALAS